MIGWFLGTRLGRFLGVVAAALLALAGAWAAGRREGRQQAATDTLRRTVNAIDQDPDLAARARSTGLLRDEPR
jgi:hypothetical protein